MRFELAARTGAGRHLVALAERLAADFASRLATLASWPESIEEATLPPWALSARSTAPRISPGVGTKSALAAAIRCAIDCAKGAKALPSRSPADVKKDRSAASATAGWVCSGAAS